MILMSDIELEALKRRRLQQLQKRMAFQKPVKEQVDPQKILNAVFKGRAWEVFNTACEQFPTEMKRIEEELLNLISEGRITAIDGEQLLVLLRATGLAVRLNTTINVVSHGRTESLSERFKKSTK
jgi:DNA-binding TFAR19-related protein (PDSD5 family)